MATRTAVGGIRDGAPPVGMIGRETQELMNRKAPSIASLAFTKGRRPTYMDRGATLRHFAKTVVNLSSGLLLNRLPIPRSRNVGSVELLVSLGDPAGGRTSAVHRRSMPRVTSTPP
ncbi:hypothetical protein RB195_006999 [Necator americanus]|uniref:Uncharacterized protein n=1 Tax=Necator americanus TaxID=51031 RepID=A0ABR1BZ09_NECAM